MPLNRAPKGTYGSSGSATTHTLASVTMGVGDVLVVGASSPASVTGVTWDGIAMTVVPSTFGVMWYLPIVSGATGSVVVTLASSSSCAFFASQLTGLDPVSSFDKSCSANGSSTTPNSGATATTSSANEILIGCVAYTGGSLPIGPSPFGGGFAALQDAVSAGNCEAQEAVLIVSATQTGTISTSNLVSLAWTAAIATFQAATPPLTVTEGAPGADSVSITGTLVVTDTAPGSDAVTLTGTLVVTDGAPGLDSVIVTGTLVATDGAPGADSVAISGTIIVTDGAPGSEDVNAFLIAADGAPGFDTILGTYIVTDGAPGSDSLTVIGLSLLMVHEDVPGADAVTGIYFLVEDVPGTDLAFPLQTLDEDALSADEVRKAYIVVEVPPDGAYLPLTGGTATVTEYPLVEMEPVIVLRTVTITEDRPAGGDTVFFGAPGVIVLEELPPGADSVNVIETTPCGSPCPNYIVVEGTPNSLMFQDETPHALGTFYDSNFNPYTGYGPGFLGPQTISWTVPADVVVAGQFFSIEWTVKQGNPAIIILPGNSVIYFIQGFAGQSGAFVGESLPFERYNAVTRTYSIPLYAIPLTDYNHPDLLRNPPGYPDSFFFEIDITCANLVIIPKCNDQPFSLGTGDTVTTCATNGVDIVGGESNLPQWIRDGNRWAVFNAHNMLQFAGNGPNATLDVTTDSCGNLIITAPCDPNPSDADNVGDVYLGLGGDFPWRLVYVTFVGDRGNGLEYDYMQSPPFTLLIDQICGETGPPPPPPPPSGGDLANRIRILRDYTHRLMLFFLNADQQLCVMLFDDNDANPQIVIIDEYKGCSTLAFYREGVYIAGTYLHGKTPMFTRSVTHGREWKMTDIPGGYASSTSTIHRGGRIVFLGFKQTDPGPPVVGASWYCRVGVPNDDGTFTWSSEVKMTTLSNPDGAGHATTRSDGVIEFAWEDTSGVKHIARARGLSNSGGVAADWV